MSSKITPNSMNRVVNQKEMWKDMYRRTTDDTYGILEFHIDGKDFSPKRNYTKAQLTELELADMHGIKLAPYVNVGCDVGYMRQIRLGLEDGINVTILINSKHIRSVDDMEEARRNLLRIKNERGFVWTTAPNLNKDRLVHVPNSKRYVTIDDYGFCSARLYMMYELIESGNIGNTASSHSDAELISMGINPSIYNQYQKSVIFEGIDKRVDTSLFTKPWFNELQMFLILIVLLNTKHFPKYKDMIPVEALFNMRLNELIMMLIIYRIL